MAAQSGDSIPIAQTDPSTDRAVPMASPTPVRTPQNHPTPSNEDTVSTPDESPSASSTPSSSPLSGLSSSASYSQSSSSTGEDRAINAALKLLAEDLDSIDNGRPNKKTRVDAPHTLSKHLPSPDSPDSSASNIARVPRDPATLPEQSGPSQALVSSRAQAEVTVETPQKRIAQAIGPRPKGLQSSSWVTVEQVTLETPSKKSASPSQAKGLATSSWAGHGEKDALPSSRPSINQGLRRFSRGQGLYK
ncbi:hypothetical protein FVEG_16729 [Fusarium verticillioides 7600]|uniref:Uncharacterized protein n=1 Tax=Gibberella moniliformis (strain M3125 / FGSC 7600) TaxID=334819 RepID=W7MJ64_GIBM7|nr:hypothetical protein FVEG_16729 [Fusarium verticillioides 7600]EWG51041.1 hypothetical protein FVEG_16729 [Fusarium verticillioides 7600]